MMIPTKHHVTNINIGQLHTKKKYKSELPDGGFLRQICKILADLKVIWQAKNIFAGLPISDGFLADLINFFWVCFCLADLADSGSFGVSMSKKQLVSHLFWQKKNC
jgi:hypothetical protein